MNRVDWLEEVGAEAQPQMNAPKAVASETPAIGPTRETVMWEGKPHVTAGVKGIGTRYELTSERLTVKTGVLGKTLEEMEVIRVKDVRVQQTPADRALGVGSVTVISTDASTPALLLHKVSNPAQVKERIRRSAERERQRKGITYRESL